MGHHLISCGSYHDQLHRTTFYEPPHDIWHCQAGPWLVSLARPQRPVDPIQATMTDWLGLRSACEAEGQGCRYRDQLLTLC